MYDSKFFKLPEKLRTHQLGPYIVEEITDIGAFKLKKLDGTLVGGLINGSQLKLYHDSSDLVT